MLRPVRDDPIDSCGSLSWRLRTVGAASGALGRTHGQSPHVLYGRRRKRRLGR